MTFSGRRLVSRIFDDRLELCPHFGSQGELVQVILAHVVAAAAEDEHVLVAQADAAVRIAALRRLELDLPPSEQVLPVTRIELQEALVE